MHGKFIYPTKGQTASTETLPLNKTSESNSTNLPMFRKARHNASEVTGEGTTNYPSSLGNTEKDSESNSTNNANEVTGEGITNLASLGNDVTNPTEGAILTEGTGTTAIKVLDSNDQDGTTPVAMQTVVTEGVTK